MPERGSIGRSGYQQASMQAGDELLPSAEGAPKLFRRKVTRKVEMPFIRRVKVQVVTKRVVEKEGRLNVKTKMMYEKPDFEEVDEQYIEYQEKRGTRAKKTFEEKVVMEDYIKKVPVTKERKVRKPCVKIEEVDDFEIVQVPGTKVIQEEGYRIDTVEDRKWVEEVQWEVVDMKPMPTGQRIRGEQRIIERDEDDAEEGEVTRKIGTVLLSDEQMQGYENYEEDSYGGNSKAPMFGGQQVPSGEAGQYQAGQQQEQAPQQASSSSRRSGRRARKGGRTGRRGGGDAESI